MTPEIIPGTLGEAQTLLLGTTAGTWRSVDGRSFLESVKSPSLSPAAAAASTPHCGAFVCKSTAKTLRVQVVVSDTQYAIAMMRDTSSRAPQRIAPNGECGATVLGGYHADNLQVLSDRLNCAGRPASSILLHTSQHASVYRAAVSRENLPR